MGGTEFHDRPLLCDVKRLDGAIIWVPNVFSCIESAIGKSYTSYNNCVPNVGLNPEDFFLQTYSVIELLSY